MRSSADKQSSGIGTDVYAFLSGSYFAGFKIACCASWEIIFLRKTLLL